VVGTVLVDSSALLALLDRADPRHDAIRSTFVEVAEGDLVTHGYVIAESLAVARRRFGIDGVIALLDDLLPLVRVLTVEPIVHSAAQAAYRASLPSGTSFVDQVTLAVAGHEGIDTIFALDGDFAGHPVMVIPSRS
jgi:predicted nucleic acid-binding protein